MVRLPTPRSHEEARRQMPLSDFKRENFSPSSLISFVAFMGGEVQNRASNCERVPVLLSLIGGYKGNEQREIESYRTYSSLFLSCPREEEFNAHDFEPTTKW